MCRAVVLRPGELLVTGGFQFQNFNIRVSWKDSQVGPTGAGHEKPVLDGESYVGPRNVGAAGSLKNTHYLIGTGAQGHTLSFDSGVGSSSSWLAGHPDPSPCLPLPFSDLPNRDA